MTDTAVMGTWAVAGQCTMPGMTIEALADLAVSLAGQAVYDHATGQLVVRYEVAGATVSQAARRAIRMARPLPPLDSLELSRT
ncbi:hypothetical protein B5P44_09480 [Mycobacterium sp. CBMA 213]|nr:hypothetical protein [Mycolicibacterium sp. CBMA 213]